MDDPSGKGKFAVSSSPINRRTAKPNRKDERPSNVVLERLKARRVQYRLGAPILQRLTANPNPREGHAQASASLVLQAVGGTIAGTVVFLGAIQGVWMWVAAGGVILAGTAGWAALQWHRRQQRTAGSHIVRWIDVKDVARLDGLLERLAQESDQDTIDALGAVKDRLSRCAVLLQNESMSVASEDALFVGETIRRYLPDSLQGTLRVAAQDRKTPRMEQDKTAIEMLHEQLELLDAQLQRCETRLASLAGEALLQQQRFLAAKTRSG